MITQFNTFLWDIASYTLIIVIYSIPAYTLSLESFENTHNFTPIYYNLNLLSISEGADELMDS